MRFSQNAKNAISIVLGLVFGGIYVYYGIAEQLAGTRLYGNSIDMFFSFAIISLMAGGICYGLISLLEDKNSNSKNSESKNIKSRAKKK